VRALQEEEEALTRHDYEESKKAIDEMDINAQHNKYAPIFDRLIIHVDMDAYYAQVEMKKHGIKEDEPMGVLQWKSLIAVNYAAKERGVKR